MHVHVLVTNTGTHLVSKEDAEVFDAAPLRSDGRFDMRYTTSRVAKQLEDELIKVLENA